MKKLFSLLLIFSISLGIPFHVSANDWTEVVKDSKDAGCSVDFKTISVADSGDSWIIQLESWVDWDLMACDTVAMMFLYINLSGSRNKEDSDFSIHFMSLGDFIMSSVTDLKGNRSLSVSTSIKTQEKFGTITIKKKDLQVKNAKFSLLGVIRSDRGLIDTAPNNQQMALYQSTKPQPKAKLKVSQDSFDFGVIQRDATPTASFEVTNEGEGSLNVSMSASSIVTLHPRSINLGDYESQSVSLTIQPKNLLGKQYEEFIKITSNAGEVSIKVRFELYPLPELQLDQQVLDFGTVMRNESKNLRLQISNKHKGNITGSIKSKDSWISISKSFFNTNSETIYISINMQRAVNGKNTGTISIDTNGGNAELNVYAEVIDPIISSRRVIDFGSIDEDDPPPNDEVIELTNNSDKPVTLSVTTSDEWISVSTQTISLAPKASEKLLVNLKLKNMLLKNQDYAGAVTLSNKKDVIKVNVTARLTQKEPELVWIQEGTSQTEIKAVLYAGQSLEFPIMLKNKGSGECKVESSLVDPKKNFRLYTPSFTLKRHETNSVKVRFNAENKPLGEYQTTLRIVSNGGDLEIPISVTIQKKELLIIKLYIGDATAILNDQSVKLDAAPYISQGSTMVPLRFIGEAFNAKVEWVNYKKGRIIIKLKDKTLQLDIGEKIATINGVQHTLNASPEIKNSRTFVPVRFISEGFEAKIEWNPALQEVLIRYEL